MRKVILYTDSSGFGGAEQLLLGLARRLPDLAWEPTVAVRANEHLEEAVREAGFRVVEAPAIGEGWQGQRSLRRWIGFLKRERPRVLHAHLTWPLAAKAPIAAALAIAVPAVVATIHSFPPFVTTRSNLLQWRLLTRRLGRCLAVSRALAANLERELGWDGRKIDVVYPGVDVLRLEDIVHASRERTDARKRIVYVGRLDASKGVDVLLDAVRRVPDAALLVVGDGPERGRLEQAAADLGQRVAFLGHQTSVPQILVSADVCVLPSRNEGLPVSILEAMAVGVPVVATNVGGIPEVISHDETGLLVEPGDAHGLAAALSRILADRSLAARLARDAREQVRARFTDARMAAETAAVYDALLERLSDDRG